MIPRGMLVLGFGGHARSVADVATDCGIAELLFVDDKAREGESFAGFRVLREWPDTLPQGWSALPASGNAALRRSSARLATERGFPLMTLVSRNAYVARGALIGRGSFVAHGAHIGPCVRIGEGCIINTHAVVEHECVVGDFTHVSVNSTVAGRCNVGTDTFLGAGSTIIDGVRVADHIVVGAGAVVAEDLLQAGTYVGVPARRIAGRAS